MDFKRPGSSNDEDEEAAENHDKDSENGSTENENDGKKQAASVSSAARKRSDSEDECDADSGRQHEEEKRMRTDSSMLINTDKVSHEQRWDEMYKRLVAYKNKHGHCLVPNRYAEDTQLGFWVSARRRQYKLLGTVGEGASALTQHRIKKLEDIGFQWSTTNPHHTPWESRYRELCKFVKKHGHAEVPMRWQDNPKLSHWVSKQRHDYKLRQQGKSSRLSDKKLKLLDDLGFMWEGSRRSLKEKIKVENENSDSDTETGDRPLAAVDPPAWDRSHPSANYPTSLAASLTGTGTATSVPSSVTAAAPFPLVSLQAPQLPPELLFQLVAALAVQQQPQPTPQHSSQPFPSILSHLAPTVQLQPPGNFDVGPVTNQLAQALAQVIVQQQQPIAYQQPTPQLQHHQYALPHQQHHPFLRPMSQQGPLLPLLGQQQLQLQQSVHRTQQHVQQQQQTDVAGLNQAALLDALQQAVSGGQTVLLGHQGLTGMPATLSHVDPISQLNLLRAPGPPATLSLLPVSLNSDPSGATAMQEPNNPLTNSSTFPTFNRRTHGQEDPPGDMP